MKRFLGLNSLRLAVVVCISVVLVWGCGKTQPTDKSAQHTKSPSQAREQQLAHGDKPVGIADQQQPAQPTEPSPPKEPTSGGPDQSVDKPGEGTATKPGEPSQKPPQSPGTSPTAQTPPNDTQPQEPMLPAEPKPPAEPAEPLPGEPAAPRETPVEEPPAEDKPEDLQPLVDRPEDLQRLDPVKPLWFDKAKKRVVMVGRVVQNNVPLEVFACIKNTKEHEAILSVDVKAAAVHAALLAAGANPGRPARWDPKYMPPEGTEIDITVVWKGPDGKVHTARAQEWVYDTQKKAPMEYPWVFAGSGFFEDPDTKQRYYLAEGGDFICLSNFPGAMLDVPIESTDADASLMFQANKERIPSRGTPVTIILTPKLSGKDGKPSGASGKENSAANETSQPGNQPKQDAP